MDIDYPYRLDKIVSICSTVPICGNRKEPKNEAIQKSLNIAIDSSHGFIEYHGYDIRRRISCG